jgi:hypothetical protein
MGNTHCTNTNSHKLLLEKLELKLQKTSCNIEKEILMEYTKIKQGIYKKVSYFSQKSLPFLPLL